MTGLASFVLILALVLVNTFPIFASEVEEYDINKEIAEREALGAEISVFTDANGNIMGFLSHIKYAPQAFEVNAFRYIPKRMLQEKITEALDCVLPRVEQMNQRTYVMEVAGGLEKIQYKNIIFISKDGKYIIIHHKNGEIRERKSLTQVMDSLNAQEFVYVNKGYIVNIQQIESLRKDCVILKNGTIFKISRSKYQCVKEKVAAYWRGMR